MYRFKDKMSQERENNLCVDLKTTCIVRENFKDSSAVICMVPSFIVGVIIY